ncbi:MAG: phosphoenolpyruvate--protein phosphotransferase [Candidatus Omnitrophica bacterium CG11_big_fil_rev_8_21_14_0_20_42_13]|uniref:Phosphoenolpyruvate-protein phosphotransferase n=1 Tax=Candidatus Ghiorseimicrobium undicola TaxID=1974746 RepID=A0A2H0LWY6_9BACT|nr:MAG: phosphoenolpyruvate--protein phosphotransferase [Candidatus Omnitrophica bacterium CG11_big_fil_rev_8_21_14_0_20_42_13]
MLKGIPASSGISIGPVHILGREEISVSKRSISEADIAGEIVRFEEALIQTHKELIALQKKVSAELNQEQAQIFDAHLLVLEDRMLIEEVISRVKKEKVNVEYIFHEVIKKYINVFSRMEDEYLRERIADINDVSKRVMRILCGKKKKSLSDFQEPVIVVAHDLSPSDTAAMHRKNIIGFVTDVGGKTSHTAIMAKSFEIPAVVGVEVATSKIGEDDTIIIDGISGVVIINPDEKTIAQYNQARQKIKAQDEAFISLKSLSAQTIDGRLVELAANIELPEEIPFVLEHGAEGIGLYRTEYFYMNRRDLPSEEEHYEAYKFVAQKMQPYPVIIRTLDLGGDKFISQLQVPRDMLPFLGWRAIRFCLARPDIFKVQLRALLRASIHGKIKIMYPMISGVEEMRQANQMLEDVKNELRAKKIAFDEDMEVGAMIEVPSAAITADLIAKEADFFSIGTNDLIQYSIAVDRTNEKVAYLYEPSHPAVLRLIKNIIDSGHRNNIWVGMCGEMSGDPMFALILLGMGLDEFSMPSRMILPIKQLVRCINMDDARKITEAALDLSTGKEVDEFSNKKLKELAPEVYKIIEQS